MKPYQLLNESIKFAINQLNDYKANKNLSDISTMVITSLYRKIIELSEGVRVSAANGLSGPAELNYRGLIEAYLAFKYILQDPALLENRAKAYKVGYHKQQIKAGEYYLRENLPPEQRTHFELAVQEHKKEIETKELQDVLNKYEELQASDKRGHIPKWHALDGGPNSINKLAKILVDENDSEKELMSNLYSFLSVGAHNYMALNSIFKKDENISINPVRAHFNPNRDDYNFVGTRTLLTSSIMSFTIELFPEHTRQFQDFAQRIMPYLNIY
jgi:hypothetical protein